MSGNIQSAGADYAIIINADVYVLKRKIKLEANVGVLAKKGK